MADNYSPKNYNTDGGDRSVFGGEVNFTGLPTSAPAGSGQLWNDGGTLKISPVHVAPTNSAAPAITGTPTVGQTLTVSNGTWAGVPAVTYARQWYADGVALDGKTATTLVLASEHEGAVITAIVTATNAVGSLSVESNATAAVAPGG